MSCSKSTLGGGSPSSKTGGCNGAIGRCKFAALDMAGRRRLSRGSHPEARVSRSGARPISSPAQEERLRIPSVVCVKQICTLASAQTVESTKLPLESLSQCRACSAWSTSATIRLGIRHFLVVQGVQGLWCPEAHGVVSLTYLRCQTCREGCFYLGYQYSQLLAFHQSMVNVAPMPDRTQPSAEVITVFYLRGSPPCTLQLLAQMLALRLQMRPNR